MSEAPFPAEAAEAPEATSVEEPTGPDRRLLVGGGLAAVALLVGGFLLLTGGDDDALEPIKRSPRKPVAAAASPSAPARLAPVSAEELGRDPFKPLYLESSADGVAAPATGGGTSGAGAPSAGGPAAPAPGTAAPRPSQSAAPAPTKRAEYELVLRKVSGQGAEQTAEFSIGGQKHTAKIGQIFGPSNNTVLMDLHQRPSDGKWVATLRVGDGTPFDALINEPVFVPA